MNNVVILTGDQLAEKLAGPALRALALARMIAKRHNVTVASPKILLQPSIEGINFHEYGEDITAGFVNDFDVAIAPGSLILPTELSCALVIDLYDPFILSNLHRLLDLQHGLDEIYEAEFEILIHNVKNADFFLCASHRQRDFWIGFLTASRRVNRISYSLDSKMYSMIDIVPFGLESTPPIQPEITPFPGDVTGVTRWLIWAGGIWNWFDPVTFINAFNNLASTLSNVNVFFMGTKHPDPSIPEMKKAVEAIELCESLGLTDNRVFFGDWIPYNDRGRYLAASWAGISTHYPHLETRYAFRTRILDYLWARLPIVCTQGDSMADIVEKHTLGLTVPPEDVISLQNALIRITTDEKFVRDCKKNLERIVTEFYWENVSKPLMHFCDNPRKAADKSVSQELYGVQETVMVAGCTTKQEPVGEIIAGCSVEQIFACKFDGLFRIDVKLATYARNNKGIMYFYLDDLSLHQTVVQQPINKSKVRDNAWHSIVFDPLPDSRGKSYQIRLQSNTSTSGNALTAWSDPSCGTGFFYGGDKKQGSLTFRAFCKKLSENSKLSELWRHMFRRRFF